MAWMRVAMVRAVVSAERWERGRLDGGERRRRRSTVVGRCGRSTAWREMRMERAVAMRRAVAGWKMVVVEEGVGAIAIRRWMWVIMAQRVLASRRERWGVDTSVVA